MRSLIVSFIGGSDLRNIDRVDPSKDMSPIVRLLLALAGDGFDWPNSRLMLFDDKPADSTRRLFADRLRQLLPELGLDGLEVDDPTPLEVQGPTDWSGLYEGVWNAIPLPSATGIDQYIFHHSSGTAAMQATIVLAACCLSLPKARIFETSVQQNVREVDLPYVLAHRERQFRERRQTRQKLPQDAKASLLPDTVIADPTVEQQYATLYKASRGGSAQRLLIKGPAGSGKRHAACQFARWRNAQLRTCESPANLPQGMAGNGEMLLLRWLDEWTSAELQRLASWCDDHRDVTVVATWRSDRLPAASIETLARDGLRGATHVELPPIGARCDIVALAEALARQRGIWDGKIAARFQHDLFTNALVRDLHDLVTILSTMAHQSATQHPDRDGLQRATRLLESDAAAAELKQHFEALAGLHFGSGLPHLDDRLLQIKRCVVRHALAGGRSQQEVADLLGMAAQTVSYTLGKGRPATTAASSRRKGRRTA